eukprot:11503038-Alexandrium_andersonii.AAC.1
MTSSSQPESTLTSSRVVVALPPIPASLHDGFPIPGSSSPLLSAPSAMCPLASQPKNLPPHATWPPYTAQSIGAQAQAQPAR